MDINKNVNVRLVHCVERYPCLYNNRIKPYYNKEYKERAWIEIAAKMRSTPDVVKFRFKRLRSVFVGTLKKMHMGELIKPYYLHEHLQFLVPYLQSPWDPERRAKQLLEESERLCAKNNHKTEYELDEDQDISDYLNISDNSRNSNETNSYAIYHSEDNAVQTTQHRLTSTKRKHRTSADFERGNYSNEYKRCKLKTATSTELDENRDDEYYCPKTHFLLSIILPDLEVMNNAQMRLFKAKVLSLINDILDN
ncbi:uncharacterized protein [Eurosta solidaginis]|uniref:uncharacterized protein n=1 Tax=Eurosta solidaginis TaxID=178769 RepID=UPI00353128B8